MNRRDALVLISAVPAGVVLRVSPLLADESRHAPSHVEFVPDRELNLTLGDDLQRQRWRYEGQSYVDHRETIVVNEGERVRVTIVNDTSMPQSLIFDARRIHLSTGESFALDLTIDGFEPRTLRNEFTNTTRTFRIRPSYQVHATFAG